MSSVYCLVKMFESVFVINKSFQFRKKVKDYLFWQINGKYDSNFQIFSFPMRGLFVSLERV